MKYNFERGRNYALWYYFRYFPSYKKLSSKLMEKCEQDEELVEKILKDIESLLDEKRVLWDKIRLYILRNKNLKYIKTKLLQNGFEKEMIDEILEQDFDISNISLLDRNYIKNKVINYKNSGKSRKYIFSKLYERKEDLEILEWILDEVFLGWEEENILKYIEKLGWKYEKQKIIQKLLQKWFLYDDVKKYVR